MKHSILIPNWNIGLKLSLSTFALVGGMFMLFIIIGGYKSARQAESEAMREVSDKTALIADTVSIVDRNLRAEVKTYAKVFADSFPGKFRIEQGRSREIDGKNAPVLMNGDTEINLNFSIPDRFTALTGAYATIFVRTGDDFIRITTSHKKENGERAIGTLLDRSHPGYNAVLKGDVYAGAASLFGGQYMTEYDPIKNAQGEVIGILYVGINFTDSMKALGDGLKAMKLGKTGEFYALSARPGKDFGKLLIHRSKEDQNLLEEKDNAGNAYIKTILDKKQGTLSYTEAGRNGNGPRDRIVAFSHIKDWQMVVAGDAYLDEITESAVQQRNSNALVAVFIVALVTALLYVMIQRQVSKPISKALHITETVASGNLTSEIEVASADETGRLMAAMQHMNSSLSAIVSEVRTGTASIAAASEQIAAGNLDLSARTEQQAGALEETASTMEELTATIRRNADNAVQAHQLTQNASEIARKGGDVVTQVISTMGAIDSSAKRIADIIGVIDGIAFQTNILALNAAVEAARAGEQGRGFAVVASEVRTLAQRSATAAKEIKTLIHESVEQVSAGSRLVDHAGDTMKEIVGAVVNVADLMNDISAATQEQAAGIDQINQAIGQMDQVTQQNAALVEEAASAAQVMMDRAVKLADVVSFFQVMETSGTQGTASGTRSEATSSASLAAPNELPRLQRTALKQVPHRLAA